MKTRRLGATGIEVSEIGFGAWAIGGANDVSGIPIGWPGVTDADAGMAIARALELGVNFFDTSDVYGFGHSEELLGRHLSGVDCVIATKVGNRLTNGAPVKDFSVEHLRVSLEASLTRLSRDTIDLYQLHNPPQEVLDSDEPFSILQQFKQQGKIRAIGVSVSAPDEAVRLIRAGKVDCIQVLFNILNQEPARELIPLAEKEGIGILARVPLASGLLTGKFAADHQFGKEDNRRNYLTSRRMTEAAPKIARLKELAQSSGVTLPQIALAFLLKFRCVPIPGARNAAQVEQNVSAAETLLSDELFETIRKEFSDYNLYLRYKMRV